MLRCIVLEITNEDVARIDIKMHNANRSIRAYLLRSLGEPAYLA